MDNNTKLKLIEECNNLTQYILNDSEIFTYRSIQRLLIMAEKDLNKEDIMVAESLPKINAH